MCPISRHFLAIPQEHYYDDYCTPDFILPDGADGGAADDFHAVHNDVIGLLLEKNKFQASAPSNTFLGVATDLSHASQLDNPYVEFRPSPHHTDKVLALLDEASTSGLSTHLALVIRGKLNRILQSAWGCVGRPAPQPLVSHTGRWMHDLLGGATPRPQRDSWSPSLQDMTDFLRVLFQYLPPLQNYLQAPALPHVVLYTDAQYSSRGRKGMGAILADTHSGAHYMCGCEVPQSILTFLGSLSPTRSNVSTNASFLLSSLPSSLFPHILRGRNVDVWVDNVATLKAAVDGT